jgi:hypothetical protein
MRPLILGRVVQTCWACPSQWDAWTVDGQYLYLRYRWGVGTVDDEDDRELTRFETGDELGGCMDIDEFLSRSGLLLADSAEVS